MLSSKHDKNRDFFSIHCYCSFIFWKVKKKKLWQDKWNFFLFRIFFYCPHLKKNFSWKKNHLSVLLETNLCSCENFFFSLGPTHKIFFSLSLFLLNKHVHKKTFFSMCRKVEFINSMSHWLLGASIHNRCILTHTEKKLSCNFFFFFISWFFSYTAKKIHSNFLMCRGKLKNKITCIDTWKKKTQTVPVENMWNITWNM